MTLRPEGEVGASLRVETELYRHLFQRINRAAIQVGLGSLAQPPVAYLTHT